MGHLWPTGEGCQLAESVNTVFSTTQPLPEAFIHIVYHSIYTLSYMNDSKQFILEQRDVSNVTMIYYHLLFGLITIEILKFCLVLILITEQPVNKCCICKWLYPVCNYKNQHLKCITTRTLFDIDLGTRRLGPMHNILPALLR